MGGKEVTAVYLQGIAAFSSDNHLPVLCSPLYGQVLSWFSLSLSPTQLGQCLEKQGEIQEGSALAHRRHLVSRALCYLV